MAAFGTSVPAVTTLLLVMAVATGCSTPEVDEPVDTAIASTTAPATATAVVEAPVVADTPAVIDTPVVAHTPGVADTPRAAEATPTAVPRRILIRGKTEVEAAPPFDLTLFNQETLSLADLDGKVVVLNFWASWCPPCRFEMPDFEAAWKEYRDQGVVFVGVAVSDSEEDARSFAEETGVTYPIGLDGEGVTSVAYEVTSLPTTVFIDREGRIVRRLAARANMGALKIFLRGLLGEP